MASLKACRLECARSHQPLTGQAAEQVPRHSLQWAGRWARQQELEVSPSFSRAEGRAETYCWKQVAGYSTEGASAAGSGAAIPGAETAQAICD